MNELTKRFPADSLVGRLLRAPLSIIPRDQAVRILRGPLRGHRWIIGSGVHSMWLGAYETILAKRFAEFVRPGWNVFDLGAHVGFYSLLASRCSGEKGHVVAFEPSPRNVNYLRRHIELNGITNITVIETAVSDGSGIMNFVCTSSHVAGHLSMGEADGIPVSVIRLDDLYENGKLPPPNVLKIDVEGEEVKVLAGALKVLSLCRPVIFLSTHLSEEIFADCCTFLANLGYMIEEVGKPQEGSQLRQLIATPKKVRVGVR